VSERSTERETETAEVTIPTSGGPFPLLELQYELAWLRGLYVQSYNAQQRFQFQARGDVIGAGYALSRVVGNDSMPAGVGEEWEVDDFVREWAFWDYVAPEDDLAVLDLKRQNPIDILLAAIAVPLASAVILSGGKFEVGPQGLKVQLHPIGEGIAKLRRALAPLTPSPRRRGSSPPVPPDR
jgi:hypothetical protein